MVDGREYFISKQDHIIEIDKRILNKMSKFSENQVIYIINL